MQVFVVCTCEVFRVLINSLCLLILSRYFTLVVVSLCYPSALGIILFRELALLKCCFTSTETVGLLGTGAQDGNLDFHTAPEL